MFRAIICSSSGGTVYTAIGVLCVCVLRGQLAASQHMHKVAVHTLPPDDEQIIARNM
jgi:hypothetical protein